MWTEDYYELKLRYFDLLSESPATKGDVRAFVGLKTWCHEKQISFSVGSEPSMHVAAFREALDDLETAIANNSVEEKIERYQEEWITDRAVLERRPTNKPMHSPPVPRRQGKKKDGFTVMSLFTGAMGLDLGFVAAGFDLRFATDIDPYSAKTLEINLPGVPFVLDDFSSVSSDKTMRESGLGRGEVDVLTGGPPCQPFSTAGKRKGLNDPRASPLKEFVRAINDLQPKFFVVEEVTGLLSSRIRHVPIAERKGRNLEPEEEKGSVFKVVLEMLHSTGYRLSFKVLNAADFGSPQVRRRLIIIGSKKRKVPMPACTHTSSSQINLKEGLDPWTTFWECTTDLHGTEQTSMSIAPSRVGYMRLIPPGGHWRHLPEDKQKVAMGGAYNAGGGRMGFYRRLSWDEPTPTVVTSPVQKASMFVHPEALRPLSIEEYKRVQGFPDDWKIPGSTSTKYRLIGNAVPVHLSFAIAKHLAVLLDTV